MLKNIRKIVVLSGGSGNNAILQALFNMGYSDSDIKIIVNAYDDGKSTGICREVTGMLGVSDIRKNHEKLHKMINKDFVDESLMKFYENRIDLDSTYRTNNLLFDKEIEQFFNRLKSNDFEYKNFNIMNIVYSQMYSSIGYEKTNALISKMLNIDDMVKLNSFDNMKIVAKTEYGSVIEDEGDIVEWKNPEDKIQDIFFIGKSIHKLNIEAIELIASADLIIISTGTFWSSIYPTLKYCDFYKYINESQANKLWVINSEQDKDSYDVSSIDFYMYLNKLGLNMNDFLILINDDADKILKQTLPDMNVYSSSLGNIEGKNDCHKIKEAMENIYGKI